MDPESGLDAIMNVGIRDGVIRSVSEHPLDGHDMIDATGLVVAPGFIDLDTYARLARFQVTAGRALHQFERCRRRDHHVRHS